MGELHKEDEKFINKRIDLDEHSLSVLDLIVGLYKKEAILAGYTKDNEILSFAVRKCISLANPANFVELGQHSLKQLKVMSAFYDEGSIGGENKTDASKRGEVAAMAIESFYQNDFKVKV